MSETNEINEKIIMLRQAVAEYFDVDPDSIKGFVLGTEIGEGGSFHSAWQSSSWWEVHGWLNEMREQQDRRREQVQRAAAELDGGPG